MDTLTILKGVRALLDSPRHWIKWETILKELDKCELICANCHREEHYKPKYLNGDSLNG
jgi:hypothetical protein